MYILQNIIEFESIWSIVEKFKYNNVINGKEFNELISANTTYERNDYVLNLTPTKTKQLDNLLNFSTYDYETKVRKKILGNIITDSPLQLKMVFSENLKYCPLCLKGGYHSYFHQLNFVYKCPFHLIELIDHCSKCKAKIKYRIIVTNTQPYNCNCGYPLIDGIEEKFSKIKNTNTLDSINSFYAWINSPLKNNENIKIYPLIGCIDVRSLNDYKHLFINGSNINKNIIHKNYFSAIKKTKIDFNGKNIMGRGELRNLYKQSKSIYSSIVKYKKKDFSKKDMHEIKILVRGIELDIVKNNVCHYLLWRKICEGIGTVKGIDNGIRRKPDYNDDIKTAAKYFNSIINSIYNILKNEEINLEDISNFILQVFSVFVFFTNDFLINTIHKNHFNHNVLNEINIVLIINKETNLCCVLGMNKKD